MVFGKAKRGLIFIILTIVLSGCTVEGNPDTPYQLADIVIVIKNIIRLLVPAAGIAFFFMLLVGGFQFMMSGGDPKSVAAARNTMTYAIIGIILVVVALVALKYFFNFDLVDLLSEGNYRDVLLWLKENVWQKIIVDIIFQFFKNLFN